MRTNGMTQQQAIEKRMAQIKRNGINDRAEGLPSMPGQASPYYEGYKQQSERMGLRTVK